jgi:hypothetical protein
LFFKKGNSLWTVPLVGGIASGPDVQVLDSVYDVNFEVVQDGVYFIATRVAGAHPVRFYDFATRNLRTIATIRRPIDFGFAVSPDHRTILYVQFDDKDSDLMLVENFR